MDQEQNQDTLPQTDTQVPENNEIQQEMQGKSEQGTEPEVSKNTIIVIVLAVIVVVLALMYLWGRDLEQKMIENSLPETQIPLPPDTQTESLRQVGTSDEIEAIEADLSSTELDALDADLEQMEQELNTAAQ